MEILGLLDTLESVILDGFKVPLTHKTLINEEEVLTILDKIRLVAQSGGNAAKKALGERNNIAAPIERAEPAVEAAPDERGRALDIVQQAYQMSKEIREGADKYADEVLANIEATTTRVLRTVKAGRERLQETVQNKEGAQKVAEI